MASINADHHRKVQKEHLYKAVTPDKVPHRGLELIREAQRSRILHVNMPFDQFLRVMNTRDFEQQCQLEMNTPTRPNSLTLQYAVEQTYPTSTGACKTGLACLEHVLSFQLNEGYPDNATLQKGNLPPILVQLNKIKDWLPNLDCRQKIVSNIRQLVISYFHKPWWDREIKQKNLFNIGREGYRIRAGAASDARDRRLAAPVIIPQVLLIEAVDS